MSLFYSAAPVVQSEVMKLWSGVNIPSVGFRHMEVEVEVFWLREGELKVEFLHGGKCVKDGPTFTDYYGFLNCVHSIEDAKKWAAYYGVDESSTAEVVATLTVSDQPALIPRGRDEIEHNKRADVDGRLKRVWAHMDDHLRQKVQRDGETVYPALSPRKLADRVIWTSKTPGEVDIEAMIRSLRDEFMPKKEGVTC
jgi:hypothetical protein